MEEFDVTIIGGGPVGLRAARLIAEKNFKVSVIEKNSEIGFPNHCSGLVSDNFISKYPEARETMINGIKGASLHAGKVNLTFKSKRYHAFVIEREKFDKLLAKRSIESGAKIFINEEPKHIVKPEQFSKIILKSGKTLKSKFFLVASGANSGVARLFGFLENKPYETIRTIQTEAKLNIPDREIVYVFTDKNLFGNWFGWVIPLDGQLAKIGLGTDGKGNLSNLLKKFITNTPLLKDATIIKEPVAWIIPIGIPGQLINENALIVGDTAMQVKPFSGGGLFTGMLGAEIAANTIIKSLKGTNSLKEYEAVVSEKITPIIKRGLILRKIYKSMSDKDKEVFLQSLDNPEAKEIIVSSGNIDTPFFTGLKLLKFLKKPLLKYFAEMVGISK